MQKKYESSSLQTNSRTLDGNELRHLTTPLLMRLSCKLICPGSDVDNEILFSLSHFVDSGDGEEYTKEEDLHPKSGDRLFCE
ncbi:hypothetical protein CEXT_526791 [Caerostris extrusa]|uniref:Uncharacterized protein n=1 Tax=Caerostris extrusa TaxID=172846 RepID=A0AAV4QH68_CAEEX|nr:hypothetical protein CEXT_526791 [Caerostris extrusa]